MNISQISLRRPVFAIVLNLVIVLFGIIGFKFLGVRDYPAIDPPNISVRTDYEGANSDIIESQITEPLEKAINGIPGVKNISSSSNQGSSNINVEFELSVDLETAANDVRDKVSQATRQLPQDIDAPPVVSKADASAQPIIAVTVQSNTRNLLEVTEYAENNIVERLQTIPGVSSISVWGEKRYAMRIWFKPDKLQAYGLSTNDVQNALLTQSVELPAGKISGNYTELSVRTFGKLNTEEQFRNLIVKNISGVNVKLSDVADVILGPENEESGLKESGVPMIMLAIIPQPGSNYVAISDEFYKRLDDIKKEIPKDLKLDVGMDQTKFIKRSISEVEETLLIALGLVILIIYLFFRDWILALRPLFDIPVSLIGAFFIMYIFGFTINVLTLLGIVLATGLVVDDGIVVTENIFKKIEAGMDKYKAAKEGAQEIYFA
ncbi:MAG: efflux RND transporter permease subunit, partial [Ginsengibacter sp.]